jgi:hypothetical protein
MMLLQPTYRKYLANLRCAAVATFAEFVFTRAYRDEPSDLELGKVNLARHYGFAIAEVKLTDEVRERFDSATIPRAACATFVELLRAFIDEQSDMDSPRVRSLQATLLDLGYELIIDPRLIDFEAAKLSPLSIGGVAPATPVAANVTPAPRRGLRVFDPNGAA